MHPVAFDLDRAYRLSPAATLRPEPFGALAELQKEGLIRHLGLSEASDAQLTEAQAIAPVVTVQNLYNVADRRDDAMVDRCAAEGIAYAADGRPIEFARSYVRGDRTRYYVERVVVRARWPDVEPSSAPGGYDREARGAVPAGAAKRRGGA